MEAKCDVCKLLYPPHSISNWWYGQPGNSVLQDACLLPSNEMGSALQLTDRLYTHIMQLTITCQSAHHFTLQYAGATYM